MRLPDRDQYRLDLDYRFSEHEFQHYRDVQPEDIPAEKRVSFCRNIFIPLTTACRYTCTYCTYFDVPGEATLMSPDELKSEFDRAVGAGCREALFTFGDQPDDRYDAIHQQLNELGYNDIIEYLQDACKWALDAGLLPHSNPGDLTFRELEKLAPLNASMGVMLETTADVDAHSGPRVKQPSQRLRTLENAGRLNVPFTTGILIGIGETLDDRIHSLLCFKRLQEEFGHIQEIIVQPVVQNERSDFETPPDHEVRQTVATARAILPEEVEVQVPPNLYDVSTVMDCGIGDLGGVSPVTDDFINPDYKWPAVRELEQLAERFDFELVERGPVYERFQSSEQDWISPTIRQAITSPRHKEATA